MKTLTFRDRATLRRLRPVRPIGPSDALRERVLAAGRAAWATGAPRAGVVAWQPEFAPCAVAAALFVVLVTGAEWISARYLASANRVATRPAAMTPASPFAIPDPDLPPAMARLAATVRIPPAAGMMVRGYRARLQTALALR